MLVNKFKCMTNYIMFNLIFTNGYHDIMYNEYIL